MTRNDSTNLPRLEDGTLDSYAWPGGYPLAYLSRWLEELEEHVLCPDCAREAERAVFQEDKIVGCFINYEDPHLCCEECSGRIPSAYAEDEHED